MPKRPKRQVPRKLPSTKSRLIAMGLRPRRTPPVRAQREQRRRMRGPSIPQMHPEDFKGKPGRLASHFQRVGRTQPVYGKPISQVVGKKRTIEPDNLHSALYTHPTDSEGNVSHGWHVVERDIIKTRRPVVGTKQSIRRLSRKGGSGARGGAQILGKGARKTGTARARRTRRAVTKLGGTRGAKPAREKRKKRKQNKQ